jgi:hypothetical protein
VVVDGLPGRKILGEHPPLGARLGDIQNRIDDLLARMLARVAAPVLGLKGMLDQQPFLILQITRVAQR